MIFLTLVIAVDGLVGQPNPEVKRKCMFAYKDPCSKK